METISQPVALAPVGGVAAPFMRDTSAMALDAIGLTGRMGLHEKILDICLCEQRGGAEDLSGKEIQANFEQRYNKRIEAGNVSARVNELVAAKRLERIALTRKCTVTGKDIHPVRVPATQSRFPAAGF